MGRDDTNLAIALIGKVIKGLKLQDGVEVVCGDTEAHNARRTLTKHLTSLETIGGGGTNMGAIVNAVMDRQGPKPELLIVATDGDTPWSGRKHKIPVVVALTRTAYVSRVPKWMTVVDLNPRRS
jgi:predicted metal-dependent peptidase